MTWLAIALGVTLIFALAALSQAEDDAQAAHERADAAEVDLAMARMNLHAERQAYTALERQAWDLVTRARRGMDREEQLGFMVTRVLQALDHAREGDEEMVTALLEECFGGERDA